MIRPDNEAPAQLNYFEDCFRATAIETALIGDLVWPASALLVVAAAKIVPGGSNARDDMLLRAFT